MNRLPRFLSILSIIVLLPIAARAAQPHVYVKGDDQYTQQAVVQLLSNAGYTALPFDSGALDTGNYVIDASRSLSGADREDGSSVYGGAFVVVAYFHCTRHVDLYIGRLKSGYHALDETIKIGGDLSQMTDQSFQDEISQLLGNDVWKDAPEVCRLFVKEKPRRR